MWLDTNGKNLRPLWGLRFFMGICIEIRLYLWKSGYISEKRNISAKPSYISENRIISPKIQLYLRKSKYIFGNPVISPKAEIIY